MDKRYSTIIFVPHARAKFRKLKVSHRLLFSLVSVVSSSLCLSTFFSIQYFTSLSQTHELTKLRHENRELQSANEQFSKSVESLRTQLHTVEDRTRKLAIIAGISTLDETGQAVRAPADGIVVKSEWANGYGNVIYISHGYGYSTRYGHLSNFAVQPGDHIKRGDVIGYVGSTGRSTGPHLHYEVRLNNVPVNPLEYILNAS